MNQADTIYSATEKGTHTERASRPRLARLGSIPKFPSKCQWSHSLDQVKQWPRSEGQVCSRPETLIQGPEGRGGVGRSYILYSSQSSASFSFPSFLLGTSSPAQSSQHSCTFSFLRGQPDLFPLSVPPKSQN